MNKLLKKGLLIISCLYLSETGIAQDKEKGLKDYYKDYFPIGVAVEPSSLQGKESLLILKEFNSITAENAMKMSNLHPKEDTYYWKDADAIVAFAQQHHLKVRGHNLCWHEQVPGWMFLNKNGDTVSKVELLQRLHDHIFKVVGRYKGKIYAWDVVNEAIDDNPANYLRNSAWYKICGEDFIIKAFEYAHEADPEAVLFYNDYNTERPEKRDRVYRLLKELKEKGVPVMAVGLQAHWSIFEPSREELETAIQKFSELGLKIQFTELDMSVYPWEKEKRTKTVNDKDDYTIGLAQKQNAQYKMIFDLFRKYSNVITGVTFWNLSDKTTWLDNYPVPGRKNHPLLFGEHLQRKPAYWEVVRF